MSEDDLNWAVDLKTYIADGFWSEFDNDLKRNNFDEANDEIEDLKDKLQSCISQLTEFQNKVKDYQGGKDY